MGTQVSAIPKITFDGSDITSGTVADARIAATIARDSELATHAALATVHQDAPGLIATHVSNAAAHHAVYLDAHALAAAKAGGLNKIIWKPTSVRIVTSTSRTASLEWTDEDVTANTSATAKFVVLALVSQVGSISGGNSALGVRKNGDTPTYFGQQKLAGQLGDSAGGNKTSVVIVALDAGQVFEFEVLIVATINCSSWIDLLGYIE